ncbi:MAG TPA: hypothetical protein VGF77_12760 [Allosphingosinicella sp.]
MAIPGVAGPMLALAQTSPDSRPDADEKEVVVTGVRDIVVNGRARHCHKLRNDPLDAVDATPPDGVRRQSEIVPVGNGRFAFGPSDEARVTGPVFWARAGTGIDQYVFRAPTNGSALCIGAKWPDPEGWGQLRRIVDVTPYRGKRVRFTAWAATGDTRLVRFWLAAGKGTQRLTNGGNTNNQPWGGNHGWTPILLEIGPISAEADHISYGFLLWGHGDVWIYNPKLEIVADDAPGARTGSVAIIGASQH